jgi:ABC-type bacteriocin/lantibiotic exporter with double-glycine peptidase domain
LNLKVEAQNLTFGYEAEKPVIRNVSFCVAMGETACISGNDGTGKSTLLKLLTGIYSDFTGSLLINGIPIGNYDIHSLRDATGILFPQENIFHGTLWENITMGRAEVDKEYINDIGSKIGLHTFLATLPFGYDTPLDPTGKRLPRNVIQKILLVRALAHKPRLLVMEEPWLGIEEQFRTSIQQLIVGLKGATVFIATNDETFARQCQHKINLGI